MEKLSLQVCSIGGVPIRIHALLPLVAGMAALSAAAAGAGTLGILMAVIVSGPLLLLTVLIHEFGHITAARRCGFKPDHVLLWPLGGLAYISKDGITPKEQVFVSSMGPATHLPMLAIWAVILVATNDGRITLSTSGMWYDSHFVPLICIAMLTNNIAMLVFNLFVPCIPLDCSQILVSLLLMCGYEANFAAKVMVGVSVPVVLLLLAWGAYMFITGGATASMSLVLALWLGLQTYRLHQARLSGQLATLPPFDHAPRPAPAEASSAPAGGGGFRPFGGSGHVLGRPAGEASEVCAGSLLALAIGVAMTTSLGSGPPP